MDNLTHKQRRKNMQNIRSEGTKPEQLVARELRRKKIYFAKNVKAIFGRPDFAFRSKRVAVFIDSDFWHGHKKRCIMPKSNCLYWEQKIKRNKERDKLVSRELKKEEWNVIRLWEKDINRNLVKSINKIIEAL